ncbi:MAG: Gx transporter family protein [Geobacteraceae bacterium]|nr:Gx transporter family protein [Geobacteraceae bacterium]
MLSSAPAPDRRIVRLSLLIAMGVALHVVESMFVLPLPVPGARLGLANIVTVLALYLYGVRDGLLVAVSRVFLGSLIGGVFLSPAFFLALGGSLCSTLTMGLFMRWKWFSVVGVCLAGAAAHNCGQLLAARVLLKNSAVIYYLPLLLVAALPTGLFTGFAMQSLLKKLRSAGITLK